MQKQHFISVSLVVSILFCIQFTLAQNPLHRKHTTENGFLSNTIYDIYQDKKGFIWFATDDGLAQYDGVSYKEFPIVGNKSRSISNIFETEGGTIWVQNFAGQFFYTYKDSLRYKPEISLLKNYMNASVIEGETIAVMTKTGVRLYNIKTKKSIDVPINTLNLQTATHSPSNQFRLFDPQKSLFYGINSRGKLEVSKTNENFTNYLFYTTFKNTYFLASKKNNQIIFGNTKKTIQGNFQHRFLQNISFHNEHEISLLSSSGFTLFDQNLKQSSWYFENYSCSKSIRDKEGNLWIGTIGDGILFVPHVDLIQYFPTDYFSSVFVNKSNRTCLFGSNKNQLFRYHIDKKKIDKIYESKINHEVKCIFQNEKNNDLLFCSDAFFHYDSNNKLIRKILISCNSIFSLDAKHYLLSESGTLSIYPVEKNDIWKAWLTKNRTLSENRLTLTKENKRFYSAYFFEGKIIGHATDGVWEFGKNSKRKILLPNKTIEVLGMEKCALGLLFMTSEHGVLLYKNYSFTTLISPDKFLSSKLYRIKASSDRIYVTTYSGTEIFDYKGDKMFEILRSDGLIGLDVVEFDVLNDQMFTACIKGFLPINMQQNLMNMDYPTLQLSSLKVNQLICPYSDKLFLQTDENNLEFTFSNLNFKSEGTTTMWYSLNDKSWVKMDGFNLFLTELPSGKHSLKVKIQNERGFFSKETRTYTFEIKTPFYKTWKFILLIAFISLVLLYLIIRARFREVKEKNRLLQEKINMEKQLYKSTLASIKAQMNPHFLFNALNTIQSFIYTNERKTASDYLVNFSELTRMILEMSNKEKVTLSDEIRALELYLKLEKMRFEDDFEYNLDTENIPHQLFQIPSMLIQPYVENAIKHGLLHKKENKRLWIIFNINKNVLQVEIRDNGIGITASQIINQRNNKQHESFATDANQKRFKILNEMSEEQIGVVIENVLDENNLINGTKVLLSIPI